MTASGFSLTTGLRPAKLLFTRQRFILFGQVEQIRCQRHIESDPPWRRIGNLELTHLRSHLHMVSWLPWPQPLTVVAPLCRRGACP
jgi:hypothetical protein